VCSCAPAGEAIAMNAMAHDVVVTVAPIVRIFIIFTLHT
jgi:hypothetical protein